ncbi:MAG: DUF3334 family protein [Thermodesulfobacteriota bacterium]|nr:DUF3334 family protein [Thermodesulfobacteriota bacterium]
MKKKETRSTDEVLKILTLSVKQVLDAATRTEITYSPVIQKINKTCLQPDIGCFVLFDGGFSGLVIINFSQAAAMELYHDYMTSMGMPEEELATLFTSDDVSNVLGELTNQIIGNFQVEVKRKLRTSIKQNQPKMIVVNKDIMISINTPIDKPQYRKVSFETANHRPFYVEIAMEKTEFIDLFPVEEDKVFDIDSMFT